MGDALLKTRVISCLSDVLEQLQNEKFIRSNVAKQILDNSCEAMHEILDDTSSSSSRNLDYMYLDSDINIEGKMLFHRFHKKKWRICVDSSRTKVIKLRKYQGIIHPANIILGKSHRILIEGIDMTGCKLGKTKIEEINYDSFIKKDKY